MMELNLKDFLGSNGNYLSGRKEGEFAYKKYKDKLNKSNENLEVIIPSGLIGINISFFLGMFDEFMKKLGKREKIDQVVKFIFEDNEYEKYIQQDIEEGIIEILDTKSMEESLR